MILSGLARLGRDAEIKYTTSGQAVCSLALAFNVGYGDKKTTTWIESALWGKQAEATAQYLLKGTQLAINIKDLRLDLYQKNDGTQGAKLTATVVDFEFAGGKSDAAQAPVSSRPKPPPPPPVKNQYEDFADDIPF